MMGSTYDQYRKAAESLPEPYRSRALDDFRQAAPEAVENNAEVVPWPIGVLLRHLVQR